MTVVPDAEGIGPVRTALWIIAVVIAAVGAVAAIAIGSWLPLLLVAGLAVPLIPLGRHRG
ncbi:hypothetical protein ASD65_11750 [Microbacterium sp. Root61]|uniref:hypothetical protein n=1 Tax=Microbacterium sp. Root61 TaxID=1736570 RepID=UPI0006F979C9|nr:hypothetical protein [Microbacterium sp. Root61]KRA25022.1 hypothetical protein ASD65_11750 [Microbacterium sp. Root61]